MQESSAKKVVIGVLVFLVVVLAGLSGWALWQYFEERNTVQEQIDQAVAEAREDQQAIAEEAFEEERRNPFRTYTAPSVFGGIEVDFPKNWNIYVEDATGRGTQINLFIHPELVRVQTDSEAPYAFRMQLQDSLLEDATRTFQRDVERGDLEANTITVSDIEGVRYEGEISGDFDGSLVALPYRDKTILMWTESRSFEEDFDTILEHATINL